ncbi:MAG: helix-turn-helix domain-containing protein [Pyrinomonadaceae bacterium]|nr:helix-turn-helix domain-containing protein [Pyrinomonadaceae bacterium]
MSIGSKLLSVADTAQRLGISRGRVAQLIAAGRLPAVKVGRVFVINESDLKALENRKSGRPRGSSTS